MVVPDRHSQHGKIDKLHSLVSEIGFSYRFKGRKCFYINSTVIEKLWGRDLIIAPDNIVFIWRQKRQGPENGQFNNIMEESVNGKEKQTNKTKASAATSVQKFLY